MHFVKNYNDTELTPLVTLGEGTARGSVDNTVGVRFPGDCAVEFADVLVFDTSVGGEVDSDYGGSSVSSGGKAATGCILLHVG